MSTKFEQLLDYLVNEEMDKANELFHEIVVEKSRDIYENLIAEEEQADESEVDESEMDAEESVDEAEMDAEESVDEAEMDAEESVDEAEMDAEEGMDHSLEDSYELEGDDDEGPMGGDAADKFGSDAGMGSMGGDDLPPDEEEQVAMDIKMAIDQLEAAFAKLGGGDDMPGDDMPMDKMPGDDDEKKADEMMGFAEGRRMTREYVEKVGNDWDKNSQKQQGAIVGKNTGDGMPTGENTKSPISSGKGKPTTGATAGNILGGKGGDEGGHNTGTSPNKPSKGINPESGEKFAKGIHNVDGMKSGVKTLSKVAGGHGAEKKGAGPGPVGAGTGDKAGQTSVGVVKSPLNGAPGRNA